MKNKSKITIAKFEELKNIAPIPIKNDSHKKEVKYKLLGLFQDALGEKWYTLKEDTKQALEYVCMRSVEQGFFFCGTKHLNEKFGVGASTIYKLLRVLQDSGVLFKRNRTPTSHNGNGNAVYMFISHPNFEAVCELLGIEWKAHEKANEKTESDETPCDSKTQDVILAPTLFLPISLSFIPNSTTSNHYNVSHEQDEVINNLSTTPVDKSHSNKEEWFKFVPKRINKQFASTFGKDIIPIWRKITQSINTVKLSVLNREDILRKSHEVLRYLVKSKNFMSMKLDEMKAYVYKGMRDALYNMIGYENLGDMDIVDREEAYYMNEDGDMVRTLSPYLFEGLDKSSSSYLASKERFESWFNKDNVEEKPLVEGYYERKHKMLVVDAELESYLY